MSRDYFETVSADDKQIGFDYQDLVFLEFLFDLKQGESVGLEVLDDVHQERLDGQYLLVQVKHSVLEKGALTNRDIDLWKTLSNWADALKALEDEISQKDVEFQFYTNKKPTTRDGILKLLTQSPPDMASIKEQIYSLQKELEADEQEKKKGAEPNPIKKYVDQLALYEQGLLDRLFSSIKFVFDDNEIVSRLRKKLEYFSIPNSHTEDVLHQLIGVLKTKKMELVKEQRKIVVDFEAFRKDFQFDRIVSLARDRKIDFKRYYDFKEVNKIDPKKGLFSKQLTDISFGNDEITEYAMQYAATSMFIQTLISQGNFTEFENKNIDREVIQSWKNKFRNIYEEEVPDEKTHVKFARKCLFQTVDQPISIANSELAREMVEGKAIEMSDKCRLGWRKDWSLKYGGKS